MITNRLRMPPESFARAYAVPIRMRQIRMRQIRLHGH